MIQPNPEFRRQVTELAGSQWGERVFVVHLGDMDPLFQVDGLRGDGTGQGHKLVRRFLRNLVVVPVFTIMSLLGGSAVGRDDLRSGSVTGPPDGQALGFAHVGKKADTAWLVWSESHVALIDSGISFYEPGRVPPKIIWQAEGQDAPTVEPLRKRVIWSDGSIFRFELPEEEKKLLRQIVDPEPPPPMPWRQ